MSGARISPKVSSSSNTTPPSELKTFDPRNFFELDEKDELSELIYGVDFVWGVLANRINYIEKKNKTDKDNKENEIKKMEVEIKSMEEQIKIEEKKTNKPSAKREILESKKNKVSEDRENLSKSIILAEGVVVEEGARIIGPCSIGKNTRVKAKAVIEGPCRIGSDCTINAYIESKVVIGAGSIIRGNLKNCIVLNNVKTWPGVYLSNGILGNRVAAAPSFVATNLDEATGKNVFIQYNSADPIDTGLEKLSIIAGDKCRLGTRSSAEEGSILAKGVRAKPAARIRSGYYAADSIIVDESAKLIEQMNIVFKCLHQSDANHFELRAAIQLMRNEDLRLTRQVGELFGQLEAVRRHHASSQQEQKSIVSDRFNQLDATIKSMQEENSKLTQQIKELRHQQEQAAVQKAEQEAQQHNSDAVKLLVGGGLALFGFYKLYNRPSSYNIATQALRNMLRK